MTKTKQHVATYGPYVFGLIWFGQLVSAIGSGLTNFALGVWVYQTTGSATQYALIYFFVTLASVLMMPVAGPLVDRWDRRWLMILSDTVAGLGTLAIWFLFAADQLEIWHIYLFVMLIQACTALQMVTYDTTVALLVPKKHLGRANGMIQLGQAVAQIAAPVLAGALVVTIGIQGVVLIDLVTFLFAVLTLLFVRIPRPEAPAVGPKEKGPLLRDVTYGWDFIRVRPGMLGLLLYYAAVNFTLSIVVVLISPLMLSFTTPAVLGTVTSIAGCGMLLGALTMSVWGGPKRRLNGVFGFILLQAVLLFLGGLQPSAPLIAIAASIFLFSSPIIDACSQALWQSKVPPEAQGRVFAVRRVISWVTVPLANLSAGPLADNLFEPLMASDGPLAGSVGRIIGTGPGRGIGLLYIVLGILSLLVTIAAYLYPRIRLLEDELPDAVGDDVAVMAEERISMSKETRLRMKRIRRWLVSIGMVLLVIVIILGGVGVWFVRRPWPQVNGTVSVPGLLEPVEVIRDQWGVPYIYAQSEHDLFFAQGYVHAQDRLWQMEEIRRVCSGTWSEVVGEFAVDLDIYMRTLRLRRVAEKSWAELDEDSRAILEAYAEGVNAYVQSHRDRLPLEFTILGVDPEPWTPIDSLGWGNMLALEMGLNDRFELLQGQMIAEIGEEAAQQLFPPPDKNTPTTVLAELDGYSWLRDARFERPAAMDRWLGSSRGSWGSNNWVVHGGRTAAGMPMLANDTHMALYMPSIWYENGLHGGRFDSVGFSIPGVPLIVIGHNQRIAWGITNLDPDVQDVYVEKLNDPENPTQYEFMGEWHDLDIISETIEVRGGEPVEFNVLLTQHGPIINDLADYMRDAEPMALRWTLYEGSKVFESIVLINLATRWEEFHTSLQYWDVLGQNFVYADMEGNIGYHAAGRIPIRLPGHEGGVPVPGWTGEYEWQGFVPFDELPTILNPPAGFIATANNQVISDDYPYQLWCGWFPGYRATRITGLLAADARFTVEDMQDIQADTYSLSAEALRPYLLAVEPESDLQAEALSFVEAWDFYFEIDRVGASIYEVWYSFMLRNVIGDELGEELTDRYLFIRKHAPMMAELMTDADNAWFDDANTPEVETRDDIVRRSLADAVSWLSERYGKDPSRWEWGRLHTATFVHSPFGQSGIPPLERLFNGRAASPGAQFTVNMAWYQWSDGSSNVVHNAAQQMNVIHGTAQRMIVDLSDWDSMLAIHTTGQSEHLFHPHREDFVSMWQNVEYHPLLSTREAVEANAEAVLTLTPQWVPGLPHQIKVWSQCH